MPLIRRIPKRGFRHTAFRRSYAIVNLGDMEKRFDAQVAITPELLEIKRGELLKVLGGGELTKPFKIQAHAFSASAQEKIKKAGGRVEVLKK